MRTFVLATAVLALAAPMAHAASFSCAKARTPDEKAICRSRSLSEADVKMATLFDVDTHLVAMGSRGAIEDDQSAWLKSRHGCGKSPTCLAKAYDKRIRELRQIFDGIASRGPF